MSSVIKVLLTVFILSALAIGVASQEMDIDIINGAITNASAVVENITFAETPDPYVNGFFNVFEKFMQFSLAAGVEAMRVGVLFGHDNPQYFEVDFLVTLARMLVWILIISLAFVPTMYLVAFLIMFAMWIKNKFFKNNKK